MNHIYNKNKQTLGEITNDNIDDEAQYQHGMPLRAQYTVKKSIHDANIYNDFNIFDKNSKQQIKNIDYNDPGIYQDNNYADISSSMVNISVQIQPKIICIAGIEKLAYNLFSSLTEIMYNNSYMTNSLGIYLFFATLFIFSTDQTEIELKNYFNFPKKEQIHKGLMSIINEFNPITEMFKFKNLIIIGNDVPYNHNNYEYFKDFCNTIIVNIKKPEYEAQRINSIIDTIMDYPMRKSLVPENIDNLQIMCLNLLLIRPIWQTPFDSIIQDLFYTSTETKNIEYLYSVEKTCSYFEDNLLQIIELKCIKNSLAMGIILSKTNLEIQYDEVKLKYYISQFKDIILDKVKIPKFKQNLKMRYTNILKNSGLNSVFIKIIAPDLFPESGSLFDVVQNVTIVIDNIAIQEIINKGHKTIKNFIANKQFIYYFRFVPLNIIVLFGYYC